MKFRPFFKTLFSLLIIVLPTFALAQAVPFIPLVGIPGFDASDVQNLQFGTYINTLYRLSISLAALLAVVKIVMAGAKYMLSDIVTRKEEAKSDIQGALVGLLIIIGAVLILNTVNTDITKNNIAISRVDTDTRDLFNNNMKEYLARLGKINDLCAKATQYENCQIDISNPLNIISEETCKAMDGEFIPGNWVTGSISNVTGQGNNAVRNQCSYLKFKEDIPGALIKSCECSDRRFGYAEDGNFDYFKCYAYSCSNTQTQCTSSGGTVLGVHSGTNEVLCLNPVSSGPTTCPIGQVLSETSDEGGVIRSCVKSTELPVPAGFKQKKFAYLCTIGGGCANLGVGNSGWSKDTALNQCVKLNGDLQDDPTNPAQGVCTYEEQ